MNRFAANFPREELAGRAGSASSACLKRMKPESLWHVTIFKEGCTTQQYMSAVAEVRGHHLKAGNFMRQHADFAATATRNGYNPLLQDYINFSVYLGGTLEIPAGNSPVPAHCMSFGWSS